MRSKADEWNAKQASVNNKPYDLPLPVPGSITRIIHTQASKFGLIGGTSSSKINAPTITVELQDPTSLQITGEVKPGSQNDDNVSLWGAFPDVLNSWSYTVTASDPNT